MPVCTLTLLRGMSPVCPWTLMIDGLSPEFRNQMRVSNEEVTQRGSGEDVFLTTCSAAQVKVPRDSWECRDCQSRIQRPEGMTVVTKYLNFLDGIGFKVVAATESRIRDENGINTRMTYTLVKS